MDKRRVIVKVPASTANLGPGFDTLGMALSLYAWIDMSVARGETRIDLYGGRMNGVPRDKSNLIYKVAQMVFKEAGIEAPELNIAMYSDIPLTRGLGSSASAIVGALTAANALAGSPLSMERLFHMATALEGHPDNVGASLFGGIVVASWDGNAANHIRLDPHPDLDVLVAIPEFQLSTEKARHALPEQFSMKDAVYNISHSSMLVAALATGNLEMIRHAMKDRIHQPYRASLIPGMSLILEEACDYGALGAALSGAGPTLLSLVESGSSRKSELEQFLIATLEKEGIRAEAIWLKPCLIGPEVDLLDRSIEEISLMEWIKGEVRA
ncbi:homoserine kinase [Paenibacillus abyssi]|uniref:Homoserine kinase n=1 Tax=Paenibacillus abyssi TaxID=1340531 RepID=A0A917G362_9BACL|nr:homoserine kinase [Paenibacillus abyssi]GGG20212.1 homoserine kinase [Paenibacillus abyssi]